MLSLAEVIKGLKICVAKSFKCNHQINYLYQISATTFFQDLKSFESTDINILNFYPI